MDRPRRVPWVDWCEWQGVCDRVLRDDPQHDDRAVVSTRISVWQARCGEKVPLAVTATVQLFEAHALLLSAAKHDDGGDKSLSSDAVRHAVSLTIVRFVNGTCDGQQKSVYARSVAEVRCRRRACLSVHFATLRVSRAVDVGRDQQPSA